MSNLNVVKVEGKLILHLREGDYVPPVGSVVKFRIPKMNEEKDDSIVLNAPPSRAKIYKNVENESSVETEKK